MELKKANLTIMVADMDRSVKFYETLGLKLQNRWGNQYAQISGGGITIGLHPASIPVQGSGSLSVGFAIDNFSEAEQFLKDRSIDAQARNEEGGQFLHFKDPDGTEIYFIKSKWG
jgi:catechol 2,3-dioxygenase-like lactoylglutathione lyase family enzyme